MKENCFSFQFSSHRLYSENIYKYLYKYIAVHKFKLMKIIVVRVKFNWTLILYWDLIPLILCCIYIWCLGSSLGWWIMLPLCCYLMFNVCFTLLYGQHKSWLLQYTIPQITHAVFVFLKVYIQNRHRINLEKNIHKKKKVSIRFAMNNKWALSLLYAFIYGFVEEI